MARQPINLFGGFYRDPNLPWSVQDCLNFLVVPSESPGTRTQSQLREFGRKPYARIVQDVGDGELAEVGAVRGQRNVEGKLFVVAGTTLYQISNAGVAIPYGTVPGVGRVSMTHNQRGNGNELKIVNGSAGYVFNTNTLVFQRITDEGYPGEVVTDFIDGYVAGVETMGRFWEHSELADALNYNTLDRYEAEGFPDRIVTLIVSHREVLVFGNDSIEPYVNTGGTTGTFERAANTVIEGGCAARFSPKKLDNSVFYLDDKRIVRRLDSYTPVRVSTGPIDSALWECSPNEIAAAYGMTLEWGSHKVYILTVPGRFSFAYDIWSKEWTRLATHGLPYLAVTDLTLWNGLWVAGDSRSGRLYTLDWDYMLDGQEALEREITAPYLSDNQNPITVNEFEALFGPGGPVTTPVDFPEQPEGPSISGSASDGLVDVATTPFQYTISGSAPLKVTLRSGTLPPGLSISQAGVLSGTPTEEGSYTYALRVTDKYGLWADHTDTVQIRAYLYDFVAVATTGSYFGTTAETWTASSVNGNGIPMTWGKRIILLRPAGNVVSDDYLATTTPKAAPWSGSATLARPTKTPNGRVYVAAGDTNLYYTDDGAETWTTVALGFTVSKLAGDDDVLIVYTGTNHYRVAVGGLTFGSQQSAPSNIQDIGYGDGMFMFATASANYYWSEDNGATLTPVSIPAPGGDTLENYCNFRTKDGAWLALNRVNGNNTDHTIARSPDGKQPFVYVTTPSGNMDGGSTYGFAQRGDKIVCPLQFNTSIEFFIAVSDDDGATWSRHDHGYPGPSDFPTMGVAAFPEGGLK